MKRSWEEVRSKEELGVRSWGGVRSKKEIGVEELGRSEEDLGVS